MSGSPQVPAAPVAVQVPVPASAVDDRPPRVLVVDDSETVRAFLKGLLRAPPLNAQVFEAGNGIEGLRMALASEFDCVLCDMHMPDGDGLFFLRSVRAHHSRLVLPVLLLSAMDQSTDKLAGFRAGASDYVTKPFEPAELVARLETHIFVARATRQLALHATQDSLTRLLSRRALLERMQQEHGRAQRSGQPYAVILVDIDHFKRINDAHGHAGGDAVIRAVADALRASLRSYDAAGRWGGEEFVLMLPGLGLADAHRVADRIRGTIRSVTIPGVPAGSVSVSMGVAVHTAGAPFSPDTVMEQADRCLYEAKRQGRDRVVSEAPAGTGSTSA